MKTSALFYFDCTVLLLLYTVGNVAGQVCSPSPCLNGGSCLELSTGFFCSCSSNFTGRTCATALPGSPVMCEFNTCANGGDCSITNGTIECTCTTDYTGPRCDTPVDIIPSTATTSTPPITRQTAGSSQAIITKTAATSQNIRQTTSSSISDPSVGSVQTWVIIIVTSAAVIVFFLVFVLFVMIMTGKRKNKNERNLLSNGNPPMTSEFTRNIPEGDSESMVNGCTAETNLAYDPHSFDAYDNPPPDYDDDRSINGFLAPAPRIYDNKELSLARRDPCPTNDYGDFSRSDDDGFDTALY